MNSILTMTQQTNQGNSQDNHLFSTGLSVEYRHPKGYQSPAVTPPISSQLHPFPL